MISDRLVRSGLKDYELAGLIDTDPSAYASYLLTSLRLPARPLESVGGGSNRVWLSPRHVVRIGSGRFRAAFTHEAAILRLLPPEVPHAIVRGYGLTGDRECLVQDRMPGSPLVDVWADLTTTQRREALEQSGVILRALHPAPLPAGLANP